MGFHFGEILVVPVETVSLAFLIIILFLIFFDYITGFLQYSVSDSHELTHLMHHVYKELMLMGIVSFSIIMIESKTSSTVEENDTLTAIDFCHITLFFLVIFTIGHIFLMMIKSIRLRSQFYRIQNQPDEEIAKSLRPLASLSIRSRFYTLCLWAFSNFFGFNLIFTYEFKVLKNIFTDAHYLPRSFDFAKYMTECLVKYTLETYERGIFSWVVLLFLGSLNWVRVKEMKHFFNCGPLGHGEQTDDNGSSHRLLSSEALTQNFLFTQRALNSGGESIPKRDKDCVQDEILLFFFVGLLLTFLTLLLRWVANAYYYALIGRAGVVGMDGCKNFFDLASSYESFRLSDEINFHHFTYKELKDILSEEVHLNEETDEASERFRKLSEVVSKLTEIVLDISFKIYDWCGRKICCRAEKSKIIIVDDRVSDVVDTKYIRKNKTPLYTQSEAVKPDKKLDHANSGLRGRASLNQNDSVLQRQLSVTNFIDENTTVKQKAASFRGKIRSKIEDGYYSIDGSKQPLTFLTLTELFKLKVLLNSLNEKGKIPEKYSENGELMQNILSYTSLSNLREIIEIIRVSDVGARRKDTYKLGNFFYRRGICGRIYCFIRAFLEYFFGKPDLVESRTEAVWQLPNNFNDIFLFYNNHFFDKCIEVAVTLNAAWLAIWACNFITLINENYSDDYSGASIEEGTDYKGGWHFLLIFPMLINIPTIISCTLTGSFLRAIGHLDGQILLETISEMDATQEVRLAVRRKFKKLISKIGDGSINSRDRIIMLFEESDVDQNGSINSIEFRNVLRDVHIKIDDLNFARLFRSMDRDASGGVDLLEFLRLFEGEEKSLMEEKVLIDRRSMDLEKFKSHYDAEYGTIRRVAVDDAGSSNEGMDRLDVIHEGRESISSLSGINRFELKSATQNPMSRDV